MGFAGVGKGLVFEFGPSRGKHLYSDLSQLDKTRTSQKLFVLLLNKNEEFYS